MELEHKDAKSVTNLEADDNTGIIKALVSVTGIEDNVKDIIEPGAYKETLQKRKPKGVAHHEWSTPVSKALVVEEWMPGDPRLPKKLADGKAWPAEAGGLYVEMQFNLETQRGREAYSDVKFYGEESEFSIGYRVPKGGAVKDSKTGIRHIKTLDLFEFSPVLHGAMSNARQLTAVKSLFESDEEFLDAVNEVITKSDDDETEVKDDEISDDLDSDDLALINDIVAGEKIIGGEVEEKAEPTLADVVAELKALKTAVEGLKPASISISNPGADQSRILELLKFFDSGSKEKKVEEVEEETKAVEATPLRKAMDYLVMDSEFDAAQIEAIDEAVKALEITAAAGDGAGVEQTATAALNGITNALDSNPDEKTKEGLKTLAQEINNLVGGSAKPTEEAPKADEEGKSEDDKPEVKVISLAELTELTSLI